MPIMPIRWVATEPGRVKRVVCLITDVASGLAYDGEKFGPRDDGRFLELTPEPIPGIFTGAFIGDPTVFVPSTYCFAYFDPDDSFRPLGLMLWEVTDRTIAGKWYHAETADGRIKEWVYISNGEGGTPPPANSGGSDG